MTLKMQKINPVRMATMKCLAVSIVLGAVLTIFMTAAAASESKRNIPTDAEVETYAWNFMAASMESSEIEICDFIHLYSADDQLTGYYVTFENNSIPAGYMIISLVSGEFPIVEFSFEGEGPIDLCEDDIVTCEDSDGFAENRILFYGAGEMYVPLGEGIYFSVYDQNQLEFTDAVAASTEVDLYDGIIDWSESDVDSSTVFKIKDFGTGTDYWLMEDFGGGSICTPTAATNILWYWGNMRGCDSIMNKLSLFSSDTDKATAIFKILYNAMGTSESGTYDSKIIDGYEAFFDEEAGDGTWSYKKIANGASYETYVAALDNNCPVHLVLHTKNGLISKGTGHCVMALGYAESNTGIEYIFVMDGWNSYGRFVKFDYYPYFFGYKIWVA